MVSTWGEGCFEQLVDEWTSAAIVSSLDEVGVIGEYTDVTAVV